MKLTFAQINTTVGDVSGNLELVRNARKKGAEDRSDLVVFPELTLSGYPPLDLLDQEWLTKDCADAIEKLCKEDGPDLLLGAPAVTPLGLVNGAFFISDGKARLIHSKMLLPDYDVFDEQRFTSFFGA